MRMWVLACLLGLGLAAPAWALPPERFDEFARLPILHEGRLKPLDSFARIYYQAVTGKAAPRDNSALFWLSGALFNPAAAATTPQFPIASADLVHRLGLPLLPERRYDFQTLAKSMLSQQAMLQPLLAAEDGRKLTADEKSLRLLYRAVDDFRQLTGSFALLLPVTMPLSPAARQYLQIPSDASLTLRDLLRRKPEIMQSLSDIMALKRDNLTAYTQPERELASLAYQINLLETLGDNNTLLRIIPPLWEGEETWLGPWEIMRRSLGGPAQQQFFMAWTAAARAWQADDDAAWDSAIAKLHELGQQAAPPALRPWALDLEIALNRLTPFDLSLLLIGTGLGLLALGLWRWRRLIPTAYGAMLLALGAHGLGLLARMLILQRPPVSTLYESTLFVSFMALAAGLLLAWRRQGHDGIVIGGGIAALLLLCSHVFGSDGDTLLMLTAVLDTNFWLATHVVCITTGYAATLVTGMMAHLYLLRRVLRPGDLLLPQLNRIHSLALFALLFTAIGTMLGGIWADQSWGRFWGWDPKENGALWIVLWLLWLVHGRLAGLLGPIPFAAIAALANIVVALAWFGVNLLSVGLHSYGFTDGAATGLALFCSGELLIVGALILAWHARRRLPHAS